MKRSGQAAIEYMTTYGWAILVLGIIGVVIWQLGLFDMQSMIQPGFSGFSVLVPVDWMMTAGHSCVLSVQLANGAGEGIINVTVVGGNSCVPATVLAGGMTICNRDVGACGSAGHAYEKELTVTYKRASDDQSFQTAGTVWGNTE